MVSYERRMDESGSRGARPPLREIAEPRSHVAENESAVLFLVRMIERRKWTILLALVCVPLLAALAVSRMTPLYSAKITVIVEQNQMSLGNLLPTLENVLPDTSIDSQIEIVKSRTLAERTVDELGLILRPEFNSALRQAQGSGPFSGFTNVLGTINTGFHSLTNIWIVPPQQVTDVTPDVAANKERVVRQFQSRLDVTSRGRSRVIEIGFASEDPLLAKDAVTTLANLYIDNQLETKFDAMQRASSWLNSRLDELRSKVETSEAAIANYRIDKGLVEGVQKDLTTEQISDLSRRLITAKAELTASESRLEQIRRFAQNRSGAIPDETDYAGLRNLREKETDALGNLAALQAEKGPRHPDVLSANAQVSRLRGTIIREVARVAAAMEAEVEAKRTEVAGLEADLESRQAVASQADTAEIGLRALEREARSDQDLLNSFLQSSKDVAQRFDIQEPDARILSQAFVPQSPSFPDKKLFMVIAIVIGAFIGLLLAYIEELLDQTFRSGDEVETAFGIPAVAIPKIGRPGWRIPFLDYVLARPASVFAENIRSLRTLLWLNDTHTRANCIVVTSARSGEGKTTTAVALARASALGGEKVVLVDCDLSRPSVHNTFKLQGPDIGLTDLLASRADRQDVTRTDPNMANLQYITAGKDVKNGSELLRSDNMISLIRELRKEYDLVIIDTPPTLTVSDAKVLGTMADAVLFCVRGRTTTYSTAMAGIKSLTDVGANVLCVALTQVRFKSLRRSERNDYEVYARGRANRMS